jgi:hypothetical protein
VDLKRLVVLFGKRRDGFDVAFLSLTGGVWEDGPDDRDWYLDCDSFAGIFL